MFTILCNTLYCMHWELLGVVRANSDGMRQALNFRFNATCALNEELPLKLIVKHWWSLQINYDVNKILIIIRCVLLDVIYIYVYIYIYIYIEDIIREWGYIYGLLLGLSIKVNLSHAYSLLCLRYLYLTNYWMINLCAKLLPFI